MKKRISNAFDEFIDVNLKTDKEIAQLSRDLKIDIAVDLKCFTQFSRFGIFVERCAPIQVNYLGYPGTSGSNCIDYIIADKVLIPQENQKHYSEKIVYLPHCYQVNDSTKKISDNIFTREELELPKDGFIFCCFNNNYKITPNVFDSWMKILKNVKDSIFWLFETNPIVIKNLQQEAKKRGVKSDRLIFAKRMTLDKHLARLKVADLFLDTLPYTAHTTSSDALWSGLPIIVHIGQSFQSRVSASLLTAIELPELITHSEKEYEDLAIKLATNPGQFVKIKNKLKKNRLKTPLFDAKLFTKNIESAYTIMHEKYLKNLPLENIEIK
jgi:predicted O-linked N-acetylglucosamine transferase (SPINDLY family)